MSDVERRVVHTAQRPDGGGWWNVVDGRVVLRHRDKEHAVAAGTEIARQMHVEHLIDDVQDGSGAERSAAAA